MKAPSCPFNEIVTKIKMLTLEVRTALSEEELSERLLRFFGACGLGLGVTVDCPGRMTFEGGGGYVAANFHTDGNRTLLKIAANGWAVQVKRFVTELP
ncbi:MAG TPA: hypothetical protein VFG28_16290 [Syntrophales bacterium]|nr:hypothetical protein [Syntrophales bacterium]